MLVSVRWEDPTDIHILAGHPGPSLRDRLILRSRPRADVGWTRVDSVPGWQVRFVANVNPALVPAELQITDDGIVTVAGPPFRLRNFIVRVVGEETRADGGVTGHELEWIRFHVHEHIDEVWVTPQHVSVAEGDWVRPRLRARFDDGVIGDLNNRPDLYQFEFRDSRTGIDLSGAADEPDWFTGIRAGATRTIGTRVNTPAGTLRTPDSVIVCEDPWNTPRQVHFFAGPGIAERDRVHNLVFLSDGYTDPVAFERAVQRVVRSLRENIYTSPFGLLRDSINYWYVFVQSPQIGGSLRTEAYETVAGTNRYERIEDARRPPLGPGNWSLAQLIYEVGLPTARDPETRSLSDWVSEWQALYGTHITAARISDDVFQQWKRHRTRVLFEERDTAFGLGYGGYPDSYGPRPGRSALMFRDGEWGRLRGLRVLLENLQLPAGSPPGGEAIGIRWTRFNDGGGHLSPPDPTEPPLGYVDCYGWICILSASPYQGGSRFGPIISLSTGIAKQATVSRPAASAGRGPELDDHSLVPVSPDEVATVLAHELGHSHNLGEEYDKVHRSHPTSSDVQRSDFGMFEALSHFINVQTKDYPPPLAGGDATQIRGDELRWDFPRIEAAGILIHDTSRPTTTTIRVVLQAGHGEPFAIGDIVRLRLRELWEPSHTSDEFRIRERESADVLTLEELPGSSALGTNYRSGSRLIRAKRARTSTGAGTELTLVAPVIKGWLSTIQRPLNRIADSECDPEPPKLGAATNLPGLIRRPRVSGWILGLYEGANAYNCDVYRPTGMCIMRSIPPSLVEEEIPDIGPGGQVLRELPVLFSGGFCPVCQYALVDAIDPTKHPLLDRLLEREGRFDIE